MSAYKARPEIYLLELFDQDFREEERNQRQPVHKLPRMCRFVAQVSGRESLLSLEVRYRSCSTFHWSRSRKVRIRPI